MRLLLVWNTDDFRCQIAGELPQVPFFVKLPTASIRVTAGHLSVDGHPELSPTGSNDGPPLIVEQQTYRLSLRWKAKSRDVFMTGGHLPERIEFDDPVRSEFQFNFGSSVGLASIIVGAAPNVLTFEVLPKKIDYREDYDRIKSEVASHAHALAFHARGQTAGLAGSFRMALPLEAETYAIAQAILIGLGKVLDQIESQPLRALVRRQKIQRLGATTRLTANNWKRIVRQGGPKRAKLHLLEVQESSLETYENQYVRWALARTTTRLAALSSQVLDAHDAEDASVRNFRVRLAVVRHALQARLERGFLSEVGARPPAGPRLSLVFQLHPLYRQAYSLCLLLLSGLEVEGHVLQMGVKDLARLYEYWCFLSIVFLIQRHAVLESQDLVRVTRARANMTLISGRKSTVTFRRNDGTAIHVSYNLAIRPKLTTPQKPDAVVSIDSGEMHLILDAKYQLQYDGDYIDTYGVPGPPEDEINTMHRYRDAVLFDVGDRLIHAKEAAALFPLPARITFQGSWFHRSLDTVGVGGLPCSPGNLEMLEQYLVSRLEL